MKILIQTIPHDQHPYPTVGNWWFDDDGTLQIRVSEMGNQDYESMVAVHELWEVWLCKKRHPDNFHVFQKLVDNFDKNFEEKRLEGNVDEPGDEPDAPYQNEHCSATGVERLLCAFLGIEWKHYEEAVNKL